MNEILFLVFNFIVAFVSDIILNVLTHYNIQYIESLKPYFQDKTVIEAAFYAGLTVLIIVGFTMIIYSLFTGKYLPESKEDIFYFGLIAFVLGYIGDIIIEQNDIFPKLKLYYQVVGSGLWGGLAILFSVYISLIGLYLYPKIQ